MKTPEKQRKSLNISLIAAIDIQNGIGKNGLIPWNINSDLELFRTKTLNHLVIAGRTTWDNMSSHLPGRKVIVLTNDLNYTSKKPAAYVAHSMSEVLDLLHNQGDKEVFVIGGGMVYPQFIDLANKLYITKILKKFNCDTFFPLIDKNTWILTFSKKFYEKDLTYLVEEYIRNAR